MGRAEVLLPEPDPGMFKRAKTGKETSNRGLPTARPRSAIAVIDVSGPLPEPLEAPLPYLENAPVAPAHRTVWRQVDMVPAGTPRELDPFECDWPWNGWTGPRYADIIRSPHRSPTFEEDLQRVLAIFAD